MLSFFILSMLVMYLLLFICHSHFLFFFCFLIFSFAVCPDIFPFFIIWISVFPSTLSIFSMLYSTFLFLIMLLQTSAVWVSREWDLLLFPEHRLNPQVATTRKSALCLMVRKGYQSQDGREREGTLPKMNCLLLTSVAKVGSRNQKGRQYLRRNFAWLVAC